MARLDQCSKVCSCQSILPWYWWENVRAPPRLGRYWEIHPLRPRDFPRPWVFLFLGLVRYYINSLVVNCNLFLAKGRAFWYVLLSQRITHISCPHPCFWSVHDCLDFWVSRGTRPGGVLIPFGSLRFDRSLGPSYTHDIHITFQLAHKSKVVVIQYTTVLVTELRGNGSPSIRRPIYKTL